MSPRAYKLGEREAAAQATRQRIVEAARDLLTSPDGIGGFTVEAVARQAGVARMTVYYQFGSKLGLLDAVYDFLAARGLMPELPKVMAESDPQIAFLALVNAFSAFWRLERLATRRLRALARLDPEVEQGISQRDEWRRHHLRNMLTRLAAAQKRDAFSRDTEDLLYTVTSFEFFDTLAGIREDEAEVPALVRELALTLVYGPEPPAY